MKVAADPLDGAAQSSDREGAGRSPVLLGIFCLLAVVLVAVVQAIHLDDVLDVNVPYNASRAEGLLAAYAAAVLAITVAAAALPERLLWIPVAASAGLAAGALAVTLPLSGELWSFTWALLAMAACWRAGSWLLTAVGAEQLGRLVPAGWLAGAGASGVGVLLIGRAGLLSWWTVGLAVLVLGILGIVGLWRMLGAEGARAVFSAATATRLSSASASICLLAAALASIYAAAPELTYDALYYKAWLPGEWARAGEIEVQTLILHPQANYFGLAQLIAVPGHLAGAEGVGRYLQWLSFGGLMVTVWWAGRRSPWAPAAAAALAVTPLLFWQATTAYEDGILALVGASMAVAVIGSLREPEASPLLSGAVLGALAGVCILFKLHLAALAIGLLLGWLLMRGARGWLTAAVSAAAACALAVAPLMVMRWIDFENPIFPVYNNVFKSPYWLQLKALGQAPGDDQAPVLGPVGLFWETIFHTPELAWPIGAFGLLSLAVVIALALGWSRSFGDRAIVALWLGLLAGAVGWYTQAHDPRYALPIGAVALLVLLLISGTRAPSLRLEWIGLAALAVTAALLWPTTVSQFFNVPGGGLPWRAAIGEVDDFDYEVSASGDRVLLSRFNEEAPPEALAVADPYERVWLSDGRDLTPFWELDGRLRADGSVPEAPRETLAAVRGAGVTYVIGDGRGNTGSLEDFPYLLRMVREYGKPVATVGALTIYELPTVTSLSEVHSE